MTMDDNSAKPVPAANTAPKQRGRPFAKGESGNPAGKPKGARHRTTILLETLMEDEAEAITGAVIDLAKGGDLTAARLVLDRILPVRKGRPINLDLPLIKSSEDVATAVAATIQTMCEAEITPNEAAIICGMLEVRRKTIETVELEQRIARIEAKEGMGQ